METQITGLATPSVFNRVSVHRLDGNTVADNWAIYGPWIMSTMKHDLRPIDAVECMQRLRQDNWICLEAAIDGEASGIAICAQQFLPAGKSLEVMALAGDSFDVWIDRMFTALKVTAISQGHRRIYLTGRMGWKKRLNSLGFTARAVTMEYQI